MRILLLRRDPIVERDDEEHEEVLDAFIARLHECIPHLELSEAQQLNVATLGAVEARRYDIVMIAQAGIEATADEDYDRIMAPLTNLRATAPRVPVLYLAIDGNEWLAAAAVKYGAADYLPLFALEDHVLIRAVKECLAGQRLPTAGRRRWTDPGELPEPKKKRRGEGNTTPGEIAMANDAPPSAPPMEPDVQ
ncbi:MAG: hypothetical protein AAFX85_17820, partial [Pseudomonadota bacterium]